MIPCKTCGQPATGEDIRCDTCRQVETHLADYLESPKGQDFVRNLLPKMDNWPEWDHEAVLRENEATVEKDGDYWYAMGWRHGGMGINADDETIARKSAALFISLWLRGFTASFADNVAHGFAMWLELQNQRRSFELTKKLGDAVLKMNSCRNIACVSYEEEAAWDKLVDLAKLLNEGEE